MLQVDTVTLVNLVADSRTVPEFIGDKCRPGPIGAALNTLLDDEAARDRPARRDGADHDAAGQGRRGAGAARRAVGAGGDLKGRVRP